ncbi:MAG: DNA mismatch repair endonuclease MutL [Lachnospiraceae bacterium]|nr:DNA mismatch repair endonuclease MutL [Lachnospiraceae bacterium]
MQPVIHILDKDTVNLIAAGEVIERPVSVVKELVENSIDAGSTALTIEIRDGGTTLVRVTDNGIGISKEQIRNAFLSHATSKIRSADDLKSVQSLGFRGEALSTIAAVAQVEMITRCEEEPIGCCYTINGGEEQKLEELGAPLGTTFFVRNLFYNTPARKKFLKSSATEGIYITELVERLALSHPEISFKLIVNGQTKLVTNGNSSLKDLIYAIYGREFTSNLIEVRSENDFMKVSGYIGKPMINRGNRSLENYFVNGRYVKNRALTRAIEDGYKSYLMQHRFPFVVLSIDPDPLFVDVNVHPTKSEVRITREEEVYRFLYYTVVNALSGREFIPEVNLAKEDRQEEKQNATGPENRAPEPFEVIRREQVKELGEYQARFPEPKAVSGTSGKSSVPERSSGSQVQSFTTPTEKSLTDRSVPVAEVQVRERPFAVQDNNVETTSEEPEKKAFPVEESVSETTEKTDSLSSKATVEYHQGTLMEENLIPEEKTIRFKIVGQVFDTYWIFEYGKEMFMMDQHAAHEKVLFERNMEAFRKYGMIASQKISPPVILSLSDREQAALKKLSADFERMGYEIEEFGGNEFAVRGIPLSIPDIDPLDLVREILDSVLDDVEKLSGSDMFYDRVATMSCKAAVKGDNVLSVPEAEALIRDLMALENPYMCPHGRPTLIRFTRSDLDKKFKRIIDKD